MISLRFAGGLLDGRTPTTKSPADEYRVAGGVYRRGHTNQLDDGASAIAYTWQPEEAVRRHSSEVEAVHMW